MTQKWGVRSGILVAILAQCAVLGACDADGEEDPSLGDGGAGGEAAGDGDGDGDVCQTTAETYPITVDVLGAWQEAEQECRATVALSFDGETHELSCSGSGSDCECGAPPGLRIPIEGVTLTVSEGDTVLFEQIDLQDAGLCDPPRFGNFEVDYVEALGEAVSSLKNAAPDLASPEPCETEADCEAVPLGAKACGGPWSYVVASKESETYDDVVALSEELERIERLYNLVAEILSDCAHVPAPDVACEEGVCLGTPPD